MYSYYLPCVADQDSGETGNADLASILKELIGKLESLQYETNEKESFQGNLDIVKNHIARLE